MSSFKAFKRLSKYRKLVTKTFLVLDVNIDTPCPPPHISLYQSSQQQTLVFTLETLHQEEITCYSAGFTILKFTLFSSLLLWAAGNVKAAPSLQTIVSCHMCQNKVSGTESEITFEIDLSPKSWLKFKVVDIGLVCNKVVAFFWLTKINVLNFAWLTPVPCISRGCLLIPCSDGLSTPRTPQVKPVSVWLDEWLCGGTHRFLEPLCSSGEVECNALGRRKIKSGVTYN